MPLEIKKTPSTIRTQPMVVVGLTGSFNNSQEKVITNTYPKLTMGYAMLSLTLDRAVSQSSVLPKNVPKPKRTMGFMNARRSMEGALERLDIRPTCVIPRFSNNCPHAAVRTLDKIRIMSFILAPFVSPSS